MFLSIEVLDTSLSFEATVANNPAKWSPDLKPTMFLYLRRIETWIM